MAATARASIPAQKQPAFDMRSLWRVASWGTAASLALALAALAGYSETGSRLLATALNGPGTGTQEAPVASREADNDRAASSQALSALAADRDQLDARLSMIERHLDDLTGSIKAQAASQGLVSSGPISSGPPVPSPTRQAAQPMPPRQLAPAMHRSSPVQTRSPQWASRQLNMLHQPRSRKRSLVSISAPLRISMACANCGARPRAAMRHHSKVSAQLLASTRAAEHAPPSCD